MSSPHRRRRIWLWIVGTLVVLIVGIRVAANPLARRFTRQALERVPGYVGSFRDVRVSFFPLRYTITDLKLVEKTEHKLEVKREPAPFAYVGFAEGHLAWKDLLRFRLIGGADIAHAKVTLESKPTQRQVQRKPPDLAKTLYSLFPFRLNRVGFFHDELVVTDPGLTNVPPQSRQLWIHDIVASVDNLASREGLTRGQPATLELRARVQRSGQLTLFITSDPLAPGLNFAGESSLRGLRLEELWGFVAGKTGVQPVQGTLNATAAFSCDHDQLTATVKPLLENAKVAPVDRKFSDELKGTLANLAIKLTQDKVPGRQANVALIPLRGNVLHPQAELVPTVLSVLRNAYVNAIAGGFYEVPEPTNPTPQNPLKQAAQAFNPKKPMKAQPHRGS